MHILSRATARPDPMVARPLLASTLPATCPAWYPSTCLTPLCEVPWVWGRMCRWLPSVSSCVPTEPGRRRCCRMEHAACRTGRGGSGRPFGIRICVVNAYVFMCRCCKFSPFRPLASCALRMIVVDVERWCVDKVVYLNSLVEYVYRNRWLMEKWVLTDHCFKASNRYCISSLILKHSRMLRLKIESNESWEENWRRFLATDSMTFASSNVGDGIEADMIGC